MKVKIEFIKDYANKKKGDVSTYDSILSSTLIQKKVAKPYQKKVNK